MRVKNTASCSSSNFDEAHETGRSDFIFLMRFPCGAARKGRVWQVRGHSQRRKTSRILWSAGCRDKGDRRKDEGRAEKHGGGF